MEVASRDIKSQLAELAEIVLKEGASDLHIAQGRNPAIRVSGSLIPLVKQPVTTKDDIAGFLKELMPTESRTRFLETKEADFAWSHQGTARFRCNAFVQQGGISIAMRLIPKRIRTLEELRLPPILETFTRKTQGFFLVVGPVGQGKSTTLAAMIDSVNQTRAEHILTIEDPIEYIYEPKKSLINQREVKNDTKDFESALTAMFREDIDVVLIGEMRGHETIGTAVTAAETGHLVLSTLHTNNAAQTINRIIDSFPGSQQDQIRIQLSSSLTGIFSQRLIPGIAGGLVPAYELLINNSAVANLIREKRVHEIQSVIETGMGEGMIDMNRCLADLVRQGEITVENAFLNSLNPKLLERML